MVTWNDLKWIREHWKGPIAIKGLLTAEDARRRAIGRHAVVVSNHGGRQLDQVATRTGRCPKWWRRWASNMEVLMDGGIRRGADIVKAMALGAKGVLHRARLCLWHGGGGRGGD